MKTLTIDGTLDGLYRVTRQAESFYHFIQHGPASNVYDFPVVVYEGVSHMQFASGPPPALVKKSDLKPEVSEATAHNLTAATISLFLDVQAKTPNSPAAQAALGKQTKETETEPAERGGEEERQRGRAPNPRPPQKSCAPPPAHTLKKEAHAPPPRRTHSTQPESACAHGSAHRRPYEPRSPPCSRADHRSRSGIRHGSSQRPRRW